MTHRPPPDVPVHLLDPAERLALQGESIDWSQRLIEENAHAAFTLSGAERAQLREFGMVFRRRPAYLGERGIGDDEGREVLNALAERQRRKR